MGGGAEYCSPREGRLVSHARNKTQRQSRAHHLSAPLIDLCDVRHRIASAKVPTGRANHTQTGSDRDVLYCSLMPHSVIALDTSRMSDLYLYVFPSQKGKGLAEGREGYRPVCACSCKPTTTALRLGTVFSIAVVA